MLAILVLLTVAVIIAAGLIFNLYLYAHGALNSYDVVYPSEEDDDE